MNTSQHQTNCPASDQPDAPPSGAASGVGGVGSSGEGSWRGSGVMPALVLSASFADKLDAAGAFVAWLNKRANRRAAHDPVMYRACATVLESLRDFIATQSDVDGWLRVETAPRTGEAIIVVYHAAAGRMVTEARWEWDECGRGSWRIRYGSLTDREVLGWSPMPPPPNGGMQ